MPLWQGQAPNFVGPLGRKRAQKETLPFCETRAILNLITDRRLTHFYLLEHEFESSTKDRRSQRAPSKA